MKPVLLINTAADQTYVGLVIDQRLQAKSDLPDRRRLAETLLAAIHRLLQEQHLMTGALQGIGIVTGPGSFTSLRIGVAVANALAFAHNTPLIPVPADEAGSIDEFMANALRRQEAGQTKILVLPFYGREPSISWPKPRPNSAPYGRKR